MSLWDWVQVGNESIVQTLLEITKCYLMLVLDNISSSAPYSDGSISGQVGVSADVDNHNGSGSYSSEGHVRIYQLNDGPTGIN